MRFYKNSQRKKSCSDKKIKVDKYKAGDKDKFLNKITESMNLTDDILNGASVFTAIGKRTITIENYKGIIEYTNELIIVQTKQNRISIEGKMLTIDYFYDYEMRISGVINVIKFE